MIYDSAAGIYDAFMAPLEKGALARWRAEAFALLPAGADILEVGAGTGLNFRHYPPCRTAVATDIAHPMLLVAQTRLKGQRLVQADAEQLPFADHRFDAAVATLVFCSIPDPERAFRELIRTVKPGGSVILLEHVRPPGFLGRVFDVINVATVAMIEDHFNRNTALTAEKSGLEIKKVSRKMGGIFNLIEARVPK